VFGRSWSNSLLRGKAYGLYIKLPSSKPLPLRLLGPALLALQRLSIWLWLVVGVVVQTQGSMPELEVEALAVLGQVLVSR
jgi:hypothetical protein